MQSWAAAPPIFVNNLWRTNIPVISTIIIIVIVIIVITLSLSREPISIDNVKNTLFSLCTIIASYYCQISAIFDDKVDKENRNGPEII